MLSDKWTICAVLTGAATTGLLLAVFVSSSRTQPASPQTGEPTNVGLVVATAYIRAIDPLYRGETVLRARVSNAGARGDLISVIGPASIKPDDAPAVLMDNVLVLGLAGEFPFAVQASSAEGGAQ